MLSWSIVTLSHSVKGLHFSPVCNGSQACFQMHVTTGVCTMYSGGKKLWWILLLMDKILSFGHQNIFLQTFTTFMCFKHFDPKMATLQTQKIVRRICWRVGICWALLNFDLFYWVLDQCPTHLCLWPLSPVLHCVRYNLLNPYI